MGGCERNSWHWAACQQKVGDDGLERSGYATAARVAASAGLLPAQLPRDGEERGCGFLGFGTRLSWVFKSIKISRLDGSARASSRTHRLHHCGFRPAGVPQSQLQRRHGVMRAVCRRRVGSQPFRCHGEPASLQAGAEELHSSVDMRVI